VARTYGIGCSCQEKRGSIGCDSHHVYHETYGGICPYKGLGRDSCFCEKR
jgi:hypothetical protein